MINDVNGQQVGQNHAQTNGVADPALPPNIYQQPMEAAIMEARQQTQCHIYNYESQWRCYAMGYSWRADMPFRFALGSFIEDKVNKVEIVQLSTANHKFIQRQVFDHQYPPTKIMWIPDREGHRHDLLATSGEHLRIWKVDMENGRTDIRAELKNIKQSEYASPLPSFDWNIDNPNVLGTCSIDTTCTIWDLEKETIKAQLIAHDKEVYDISFAAGVDCFASAGADGSIRQFDMRNLEHSTIVYESKEQAPFVRVAWNRSTTCYLACIMMNSNKVLIMDIRYPVSPILELNGHGDFVNSIAWAPNSRYVPAKR
eukprot:TRINITY_DN1349_c0_g1_i7.p1 TRINITY_DN1349_c0_g1~~TRINITY_DN1349_c0_g1_i7.p1  ORF type:complete len:313 (-),score=58.09 TRINITY_DN1349_c0_g1_i7:248-1186(-)